MVSVALALGAAAAFGIWKYLNQTQETVKKLTATRPAVVAAREIKAGTKLVQEDLTIKQIPVQSFLKDYYESPDKVIGLIPKSTIQSEEIITATRLLEKGAKGGLAVVIPEGKRAITIMVNEVIGVGGFVSPGDYVDVLSVYKKAQVSKDGQVQEGDVYSKAILQNVLVLGVGDKLYDPDNLSDPMSKIVNQITLALSLQDSEKLALAVSKSLLHLALRPHGDNTIIGTIGALPEDLYESDMPTGDLAEVTNTSARSFKPYKGSIELILGNAREYYNY